MLFQSLLSPRSTTHDGLLNFSFDTHLTCVGRKERAARVVDYWTASSRKSLRFTRPSASPAGSVTCGELHGKQTLNSLQTRRTKLSGQNWSMGGGVMLPHPNSAAAAANESRGVASTTSSRLEDGDGVVIVDHGSRRAESNVMLHEFVNMYKEETGHQLVEAAHMELAAPTIADAFDQCVKRGATRIIICPYFLFPGRHWDKDIPALAAEAAKKHPRVSYLVTAPIGLHKAMVMVIQDRMQYCLSQVAGEVSECDMCKGSGRCKQLISPESHSSTDTLGSSIETLTRA